jgi:hypothetical protein
MRSFVIAWLVAFLLVAAGASAVGWFVGKTPAGPAVTADSARPSSRGRPFSDDAEDPTAQGPFSEAEAILVVARRLPTDATGDLARNQLMSSARVTYHSNQHWRVCFDGACWIAHGPGRYAEPENDLARQREGRSSATP